MGNCPPRGPEPKFNMLRQYFFFKWLVLCMHGVSLNLRLSQGEGSDSLECSNSSSFSVVAGFVNAA